MLLNDFFTISEMNAEPGKLVVRIGLNAKHRIFDGHFPGNPVTPGVVQLQMVKEILESHFKKDLSLKIISKCKFLNILNPENTPVITITIDFSIVEEQIKMNAAGAFEEQHFLNSAEFTSEQFSGNKRLCNYSDLQ